MKSSKVLFAIATLSAAFAASAAKLSYSLIENATSSKAEEVVSKGVVNINSEPTTIASGQFRSYIKEVSLKPDEANPAGPKKLVIEPGEVFSGYNLQMKEVQDSLFAFSLKQDQLESLTKKTFSMDEGNEGDEGQMYIELPATSLKSSTVKRKLAIGEKAVLFTSEPVNGSGEGKNTASVNHSLRVEVTRLD